MWRFQRSIVVRMHSGISRLVRRRNLWNSNHVVSESRNRFPFSPVQPTAPLRDPLIYLFIFGWEEEEEEEEEEDRNSNNQTQTKDA